MRFTTAGLLAVVVALSTAAPASAKAAAFADTQSITADGLRGMSLKELRHHLRQRGALCSDCVEKNHFRERLAEMLAMGAGSGDGGVLDEAGMATFEAQLAELEDKKKQRAAPTPAAGASGADDAALNEMLKAKMDENQRMKDILRKAGMDTSHVNVDGMGGMGDLYSEMYRDQAKEAGKKKKKGKNGKKAAEKAAEEAPPAEEAAPVADAAEEPAESVDDVVAEEGAIEGDL